MKSTQFRGPRATHKGHPRASVHPKCRNVPRVVEERAHIKYYSEFTICPLNVRYAEKSPLYGVNTYRIKSYESSIRPRSVDSTTARSHFMAD